jgi:hypothetical protein
LISTTQVTANAPCGSFDAISDAPAANNPHPAASELAGLAEAETLSKRP